MQNKKSLIRSIRIPIELLDRIKTLALKDKRSTNYWIVNALEEASKSH